MIVYVTRTKRAEDLAERLSNDGFEAKPYHGRMKSEDKIANQNAFMSGDVRIIVATSAFGMGVDKSDVGLVVHYDISDSLENYVQEAGRAGRDENINADCYVLFNEEDLSKHFLLLNQTKITIKEIQQVWKAIKDLTKRRAKMSNSALEIARAAGWDDSISDVETRVRTALASLEQAEFLRRGQNMPHVYATGILVRTAQEAIDRIEASGRFNEKQKVYATRIIKSLVASRSRAGADSDAESRVDYLSDRLGISREDTFRSITLLREEGILADSKDLTAFFGKGEYSQPAARLKAFMEVEAFLMDSIPESGGVLDFKELNGKAEQQGLKHVDLKSMQIILNFWEIKGWIKKQSKNGSRNVFHIVRLVPGDSVQEKKERRYELASFIAGYLSEQQKRQNPDNPERPLQFSVLDLSDAYSRQIMSSGKATSAEVEDALFFLSRIGVLKIEGGFLVIYNALSIERLEMDNKRRFKQEDYSRLAAFYAHRMEQIHIVGEYAKKMISNYNAALDFVEDYFQCDYSVFLAKYFRGRREELSRNMTPTKFKQIFGELSPGQFEIIKDRTSKYIVVVAGPGSGKTKLLVHKLASLLMMEDVRHEQLLMLTFSRAAATEFKARLYDLIGNAAAFVDIMTFHSYCFDLLGKIGSLEDSKDVVKTAVEKIKNDEVQVSRITKTMLVIDEAQDMDADSFELVRHLARRNPDMQILAVGDDDQNIYAFRDSSPEYMAKLLNAEDSKKYELVENYRSVPAVVDFANAFAKTIHHRMKENPIMPKKNEAGVVALVRYTGGNMEIPLVRNLIDSRAKGTTAILTRTNEEAFRMLGLLQHNGINARLIQENTGFRLKNMAELRFFLRRLDACNNSSFPDELWENAKGEMKKEFSKSDKLPLALAVIKSFESVNTKVKYTSDFLTFLWESDLGDFVEESGSSITVSTIHKAKGREFDNVQILLSDAVLRNDDERRVLYVGFSRAKTNLTIHVNNGILDGIKSEGMMKIEDRCKYPQPESILLNCSLKDVNLGSFSADVSSMRSGDPLEISGSGIYRPGESQVGQFSKAFMQKIEEIKQKGYRLESAKVNFCVWWKGEDRPRAELVLLPQLKFVIG